jgi:hypothetical protein
MFRIVLRIDWTCVKPPVLYVYAVHPCFEENLALKRLVYTVIMHDIKMLAISVRIGS